MPIYFCEAGESTYNGEDDPDHPHANGVDGELLIIDRSNDRAHLGKRGVVGFIREDILGVTVAKNAGGIAGLIQRRFLDRYEGDRQPKIFPRTGNEEPMAMDNGCVRCDCLT